MVPRVLVVILSGPLIEVIVVQVAHGVIEVEKIMVVTLFQMLMLIVPVVLAPVVILIIGSMVITAM